MNAISAIHIGDTVYSDVVWSFGEVVAVNNQTYTILVNNETHEATRDKLRRARRVYIGNIGDGDE